MYLTLLVIFIFIALVLIALGFYRTEHTELSLIGFLFLFLISMVILTGSIEFKIGTDTNYSYSCYECGQTSTPVINATTTRDIYTISTLSEGHTVGYWLAVVSVIGFVGVLVSLRKEF